MKERINANYGVKGMKSELQKKMYDPNYFKDKKGKKQVIKKYGRNPFGKN